MPTFRRRLPRIFPPLFFATALVGLVALAACGGEDVSSASANPVTVRDSAGIRIVTTDPAGVPVWSAEAEPLLSVGSPDGLEDALYRVSGLDRLSDGTWVVANGGLSEIRMFDAEGAFVGAIGGPGEGPGEFTRLAGVFALPGDSILAWDLQRRRGTVFDRDGEIARAFTPTTPGADGPAAGGPASPVAVLRGGALVMDGGSLFGTDGEEPTDGDLVRPEVRTLIGDAEGTVGPELARMAGSEMWLVQNESFVSVRSVPFAKTSDVAGGLDRVFTGVTERPEIRVWSPEGVEVARWRVSFEPPPVTDGDWQRALSAELEGIEDQGRRQETTDFYAEVPRPERHPAWTSMVTSEEGRLWVRRFRPPGVDGPAVWWVFDAEGAFEREVRLPSGLEVRWIRGDTVAGVQRDDLDVEYLRVWRVAVSDGIDPAPLN